MANRAYLYFTDDVEALTFEQHYQKRDGSERRYMDSRHQFPLAWFLFFHSLSVRAEVEPDKYRHDIYLVRDWSAARADFERRVPLLLEWFEGKLTSAEVDEFLGWVESLMEAPDEIYLVADPFELEIEDEPDERRVREALGALDNPALDCKEKFEPLDVWSSTAETEDQQRLHDKVFGVYYGP